MRVLGVNDYYSLDYSVDSLEKHRLEVRHRMFNIVQDYKPDLIFTPWLGSRHQDHMQVGICTRQVSWHAETRIFYYTLPNDRVGFVPDVLVPLEKKYCDIKQQVIRAYKSQFAMRKWLKDSLDHPDQEYVAYLRRERPALVEVFQENTRVVDFTSKELV
jgi:LmbE family N-acetylglucosaminyl deacetylase